MSEEVKFDDYAPIIQELGFNSPDELKNAFQERESLLQEKEQLSTKLGEFEPKISEYETQLNEYKGKLSELEVKVPKDPFIQGLNDLHSKGASQEQIETYWKLSKVDVGSLSPKDAYVMRSVWEKGLTEREALEDLEFQGLLPEDHEDYDERKARKVELDLKKALPDTKKFLEQYRKELSVTDAQVKQEEQKLIKQKEQADFDAYVQSIEQQAPDVAKLDTINIELGTAEQSVPFELKIRDEFKSNAADYAKQYAINNKLDLSKPEDRELVSDHIKKSYWYLYGEEIVKEIKTHLESVTLKNRAHQNSVPYSPQTVNPQRGGFRVEVVERK